MFWREIGRDLGGGEDLLCECSEHFSSGESSQFYRGGIPPPQKKGPPGNPGSSYTKWVYITCQSGIIPFRNAANCLRIWNAKYIGFQNDNSTDILSYLLPRDLLYQYISSTLETLSYLIFTHLKLCFATATHNFKWVKITHITHICLISQEK